MKSKIKFKNPKPITDSEIKDIEKFTGFKLPSNIKVFFKNYAESEIQFENQTECFFDLIYNDGWKTDDGLQKVESLNSIKERWEYRNYLEHFQNDFKVHTDYVESDKLFPVIETYSGSQIYVSIGGYHDGKIFHVDNGDFGFCLLANSLDEFFDKCYPLEE